MEGKPCYWPPNVIKRLNGQGKGQLSPSRHGRSKIGQSVSRNKFTKTTLTCERPTKLGRRDILNLKASSDKSQSILICNSDKSEGFEKVSETQSKSEVFWTQILGLEALTSNQVADQDFKICLGQSTTKVSKERMCKISHDDQTYCPLQKDATEDQLRGLMIHNDHSLGTSCLITNLQEIQPPNKFINILFTGQSKINRKRQNREIESDFKEENIAPKTHSLDPIIKMQVENIINNYLAPARDGTFRCASCRNCTSCAPICNLTRKQKLNLIRARQNSDIYKNVQIVQDPSDQGKLRIITKLPVNKDDNQSKNYAEVVYEFDQKMSKLGGEDKLNLQGEMNKSTKNGFVIKLANLPPQTQDFIMSQKPHFVSVSPAFKGGHDGKTSTPARICFNLSKPDKITKESQND